MENHQQLNSTQPAPPAHPTRLAHPAGRARAEQGIWQAAERKGKEQSAKKRKKKKTFARAAENPAQKGQERKQRIRNTRQAELFRSEEVSKILGHQGRGRMGKYEHTGQGVRDTSGNNRDISTSSPSRSWGREGRRNRGIQ